MITVAVLVTVTLAIVVTPLAAEAQPRPTPPRASRAARLAARCVQSRVGIGADLKGFPCGAWRVRSCAVRVSRAGLRCGAQASRQQAG
jgi:hypothetical protein